MLISVLQFASPGASRPGDDHFVERPRSRACPECSAPLIRASACMHCPHCGWGRCG